MKTRNTSPISGFSMLEMITVLAVMTALSLAFVPALVTTIDRQARLNEQRALQRLRGSVEDYVMRMRTVPAGTNLFLVAGADLGWNTTLLRTNARGQPRAFLTDPGFRIGATSTSSIPYTQTSAGSLIQPVSPRFLVVSSLNHQLPTNVFSGAVLTTTHFNEIWNTIDGAKPASWSWTGTGNELLVERIDLGPFFAQLQLSCADPATATRPSYRIDGSSVTFATTATQVNAWFVRGTELYLPDNSGDQWAAVRQILQKPLAYLWENEVWRAPGLPVVPLRTPVANDYAAISQAFSGTAANPEALPSATSTTPATTLTLMQNYINAYNAWAGAGFPYSGSTYTALTGARATLANGTSNLVVSSAR